MTDAVKAGLRRLEVEVPSWAYGNSGTRFKVFGQPGVPRDPFEKLADAAQVHRFTGAAPSVSLHIPWDAVDDYGKLAAHAADVGVRIGMINSNVFQDDDYRLGSVCNPDPRVRRKATSRGEVVRRCRMEVDPTPHAGQNAAVGSVVTTCTRRAAVPGRCRPRTGWTATCSTCRTPTPGRPNKMVVPSGLTRGSSCSRLEITESIEGPRVSTRDPRAHKIVSFPLKFEEPAYHRN